MKIKMAMSFFNHNAKFMKEMIGSVTSEEFKEINRKFLFFIYVISCDVKDMTLAQYSKQVLGDEIPESKEAI
jgi:hypothetical protein